MRRLVARACLTACALWLGASAWAQGSLAKLPEDLHYIQLTGKLVVPPLILSDGSVFAATDDRNLWHVDPAGKLLWKITLDRPVCANLCEITLKTSSETIVSVLVPLSSGIIELRSEAGELIWARQREPDELTRIALDDGRTLLFTKSGEVDLLNPDASVLFPMTLPGRVEGLLKRIDGLWVAQITNGDSYSYLPQGAFVAFKGAGLASGARIRLQIEDKKGAYALDAASPLGVLHFEVQGACIDYASDPASLGSGCIAAWGDSLWRFFLWAPQHRDQSQGIDPARAVAPPPRSAADEEISFESKVLSSWIDLDPLHGWDRVISHIREVMDSGSLSGRLDSYEDILLGLLGDLLYKRREATLGDDFLVSRCTSIVQLLSRFPNARMGGALLRFGFTLFQDRFLGVRVAWVRFYARLGFDPGANIARSLLPYLEREARDGLQPEIRSAYLEVWNSLSRYWPLIPERNRFQAIVRP